MQKRLTTIIFPISLLCALTFICQPNASEAAITLLTYTPRYSSCGNVSINGYVVSSSGTITRLSWDWGDGVIADSWFSATHRYARCSQKNTCRRAEALGTDL